MFISFHHLQIKSSKSTVKSTPQKTVPDAMESKDDAALQVVASPAKFQAKVVVESFPPPLKPTNVIIPSPKKPRLAEQPTVEPIYPDYHAGETHQASVFLFLSVQSLYHWTDLGF